MKIRALSAIVAVLMLVLTSYFCGEIGLYSICTIIAGWSAWEYSRLAFGHLKGPAHIRFAFLLLTFSIFSVTVWAEDYALALTAIAAILFLTFCVILVQRKTELQTAMQFQSVGLMGFLYAGIFPALATKTIQLPGGSPWLFSLLLIVFSGDTMAYLIGRGFGKSPLLTAISPKKTVEGALGGLLGAAGAGVVMSIFLIDQVDIFVLVPTAIVTGIFAQIGDLFESLIKRVAEVKDSGTIMPGHGGALDRVDGVIFAAPIYYVLFRFFLS